MSFAVCDRCSLWFNIIDLRPQLQWNGEHLFNQRILVCESCTDVPQPQLRARVIPPDPSPTLNARPENFLVDDYDYRVTEDEDIRVTEDDSPRVTENVANNREDAP